MTSVKRNWYRSCQFRLLSPRCAYTIAERIPATIWCGNLIAAIHGRTKGTAQCDYTIILWLLTCITLDITGVVLEVVQLVINDDRFITILNDVTTLEVIETTSHESSVGIYALKNVVQGLLETLLETEVLPGVTLTAILALEFVETLTTLKDAALSAA